jgi:hypothetical protein
VVFTVLIRGALTRQRDLIIPVAALAVAILAVLHSLIDFTLQIPGYSIVAMALIGTGLAQSLAASRDKTPEKGGILVKNQSRVCREEAHLSGDY